MGSYKTDINVTGQVTFKQNKNLLEDNGIRHKGLHNYQGSSSHTPPR